MPIFCWNDWNVEHIATHAVLPEEAEEIVRGARPPFPRDQGNEKYLVWGQTSAGRYLQVIYILPDDENVDVDALDMVDEAYDEHQDHTQSVSQAIDWHDSRGIGNRHKRGRKDRL